MIKFYNSISKTCTLISVFLFYNCVTIDPVSYTPQAKPKFEGIYSLNDELLKAELLAKGRVFGLESLDVDDLGFVYGGDKNGNILKISPDGSVQILGNTGGRPLGVQLDENKNLIIADAYKGLLQLTPGGIIKVLVSEYNGVPFRFTDDLDISKDGKIYFSDASIYEQKEYLYDLLESRAHGCVFVYDPKTSKTDLLMDNLYFANGIALSKNEDFLLVNETYRYRITRFWLKGNKVGQREIFIDNLPGFPDNITRNQKGEFWVSLFTIRNDRMDNMHPSPFKKSLTSKLPKFLWPKPEPFGYVLKLDQDGIANLSLMDSKGAHLKEITSAIEKNGKLYLGSLYNDRIGILNLDKVKK